MRLFFFSVPRDMTPLARKFLTRASRRLDPKKISSFLLAAFLVC
jgi:hypothetical protein